MDGSSLSRDPHPEDTALICPQKGVVMPEILFTPLLYTGMIN